jgi:hypothetical protein
MDSQRAPVDSALDVLSELWHPLEIHMLIAMQHSNNENIGNAFTTRIARLEVISGICADLATLKRALCLGKLYLSSNSLSQYFRECALFEELQKRPRRESSPCSCRLVI